MSLCLILLWCSYILNCRFYSLAIRLDNHGRPLFFTLFEWKCASIHDSHDWYARPRRKDHQPIASWLAIISLIAVGPLIPLCVEEVLHSCSHWRIAVCRNVLVWCFVIQLLREVTHIFHSVVAEGDWDWMMCCVVSLVCLHLGHWLWAWYFLRKCILK